MDEPSESNITPARGLRILAADEDQQALEKTATLLVGLGHDVTACAVSVQDACDRIACDDPDVAVVVVHNDVDHALSLIDEISEVSSGPVVAVLGEADAEFAEAAARRGLSALAAELTAESLQGAIEVATRRHADTLRLTEQVDQLEHALARRAVIERAKGILMERHDIDERGAFELLRRHARSRNRSVYGLAHDVTEGLELPTEAGTAGS